jgi:hypothetical protein
MSTLQSIVSALLYVHSLLEFGAGVGFLVAPELLTEHVFGSGRTLDSDIAKQAATLFAWSIIIQGCIAAAIAAHDGAMGLKRCAVGIFRLVIDFNKHLSWRWLHSLTRCLPNTSLSFLCCGCCRVPMKLCSLYHAAAAYHLASHQPALITHAALLVVSLYSQLCPLILVQCC